MTPRSLASLAALSLAAAAPLPVAAEGLASSTASTASSAGSAVSGSVSDSLKGSSNSSAGGAQVAEGRYRVIDVAALPDRPGHVAIHLRPGQPLTTAAGQAAADLWLHLPLVAMGDLPLQAGDEVETRVRAHGVTFARAEAAREPFFLAVHSAWQGELGTRAVPM